MAFSNPYIPEQPLGPDGAWTDFTPLELPPNAKTLGVLVRYTGGAAGGAVKLRVRKGIEEEGLGLGQVVAPTVTLSGTVGSQTLADGELKRPVTGEAETVFALEIALQGGWKFMTVDVAEYGDTANPGTVRVDLVMGS